MDKRASTNYAKKIIEQKPSTEAIEATNQITKITTLTFDSLRGDETLKTFLLTSSLISVVIMRYSGAKETFILASPSAVKLGFFVSRSTSEETLEFNMSVNLLISSLHNIQKE